MKAPEDETMKWKRNAKDGVSPVIAVILMVAITVVLAGVVVLWVTRLSKTEEEGPEMLTLDVKLYDDDINGDYMEIYNNGGGTINWANYKITIDGTPIAGTTDSTSWTDGTANLETEVGEKVTIDFSTNQFEAGLEYTVKVTNIKTQKVVWEQDIIAEAA